jgi:hypothetical protein
MESKPAACECRAQGYGQLGVGVREGGKEDGSKMILWDGEISVVECLHSMNKALGCIPSIAKKKKQNNNNKG